MSTFVLKKEYALQLPSSYVDIDREEMEYIDGGATYSGAKGWAAAAMVAIGYGSAYFLGKIVTLLAPFGPVAWIFSAAAFSAPAYIAASLGNAGAQAMWYMARKGRFTIRINNNPFSPFSVS